MCSAGFLDFLDALELVLWERFQAIALSGEDFHVFHGVVIEFTAGGLVGIDEGSVAVVVGWG